MDKNEHTMGPGTLACTTAPDAIDAVCIHKDRFAELVRKETILEILRRAYLDLDLGGYQLDAMLTVLLGDKKGEGDAE